MEVLDRMPWAAKDSVFRKLAEIAEVSNMSKADRIKYDSALRHYRDTISVLQGARDSGRAEGRAEGLSEGLSKGRESIARRMKSAGLPVAQIMEFTGLSAQQIAQL